MTTCKDAITLLLDYVDGALPPDVRGRLEAHFGDCSPCEEFLQSYKATPGLCRKALEHSMPDSVANKLSDFLKKELGKAKPG